LLFFRYDYRSQTPLSRDEVEEMGVKMKKQSEVSIEKEFDKLQKLDIDTWENKRGPRPWEINDNPPAKDIL
jgi:cytochrome c oxidase assembly protein subunit 16